MIFSRLLTINFRYFLVFFLQNTVNIEFYVTKILIGNSLHPLQQSFEEGGLFVGGGGDLMLHRVNQGHELINFGDDAVLLGECPGGHFIVITKLSSRVGAELRMDAFEAAEKVIISHDVCHVSIFSTNNLKVAFLVRCKIIITPHNNDAGWIDNLDF